MKDIRAKALRPVRISLLIFAAVYLVTGIFGVAPQLTVNQSAMPTWILDELTDARLNTALLFSTPHWCWMILLLATIFGVAYHIEIWKDFKNEDGRTLSIGMGIGVLMAILMLFVQGPVVPIIMLGAGLATLLGTMGGTATGYMFGHGGHVVGSRRISIRGTSTFTLFGTSLASAGTYAYYLGRFLFNENLGFAGVLMAIAVTTAVSVFIAGLTGVIPMIFAIWEDLTSGAALRRYQALIGKTNLKTA